MARNVFAPLFWISAMIGRTFAAWRSALAFRAVAPASRPVEIALPKIVAASDLVAAASAIVEAIAAGTVTPSEAAALSTAVSGVAKAVETYELAERLTRLEEQTAAKGGTP
jgi:hypothetical protein